MRRSLVSNRLQPPTCLQHLTYRENVLSAFLDVSSNLLTGDIPVYLANMTNAETLRLGDNDFGQGTIPVELFALDTLRELSIQNSNLTGPLSPSIGDLVSLTTLRLERNALTGNIPEEIGNLDSLLDLELRENSLEGLIPNTISNLVLLGELSCCD